jgi:hypothetical protein
MGARGLFLVLENLAERQRGDGEAELDDHKQFGSEG